MNFIDLDLENCEYVYKVNKHEIIQLQRDLRIDLILIHFKTQSTRSVISSYYGRLFIFSFMVCNNEYTGSITLQYSEFNNTFIDFKKDLIKII